MHYVTDEDEKKFRRNKELFERLLQLQAEYLKTYENYNSGKASAEELTKVEEERNQIHEEWRRTIGTLKKIEDK